MWGTHVVRQIGLDWSGPTRPFRVTLTAAAVVNDDIVQDIGVGQCDLGREPRTMAGRSLAVSGLPVALGVAPLRAPQVRSSVDGPSTITGKTRMQ